jgi:hypothetical protein
VNEIKPARTRQPHFRRDDDSLSGQQRQLGRAVRWCALRTARDALLADRRGKPIASHHLPRIMLRYWHRIEQQNAPIVPTSVTQLILTITPSHAL